MKISIITPSFQQSQFLEQTIDSVLSQNYPVLEYMVIDGGSTDGSKEIIKKYEKHLAFWVSEKDNGQSHAINKGLSKATGEVVNWLNSDDYYAADTLKKISEYFQDPTTIALCARSNIVKEQKIISKSSGADVYKNNLAKTIGWARIDQPETFFRLNAYREIGFLNESLHYVMDKEWWIRYLFHFGLEGIKQIDDVIVNFRLHDNSKTATKKVEFEKESNGLFLNLAQQANLTEIAKAMEINFPSLKFNHSYPLHHFDSAMVLKSIYYYFLLKADQQYYAADFKKARKILNQINIDYLETEDLKLFKKLDFRTKYWVESIVKFIRG